MDKISLLGTGIVIGFLVLSMLEAFKEEHEDWKTEVSVIAFIILIAYIGWNLHNFF